MLLVAVTGPVGSGKSSLLALLAQWALERKLSVDGFISEAAPRVDDVAPFYELKWISNIDSIVIATRKSGAGFDYNSEAFSRAEQWAEGLSAKPPEDLIIADEFGKLEAEGEGHLSWWPLLEKSKPHLVVLSVRSGLVTNIESKIGHTFDVIVDTSNEDAFDVLTSLLADRKDWERIGLWGAGSGSFEASVGSALHGIKFPLTGVIMSSAQAVVMKWAGDGLARRERVIWVPFISAGLKAFSPTGSRLGVMLAITVQGFFFALATRIVGWNKVGLGIGGFLVGAWAGAHGFLIQYLLLGKSLEKAYASLGEWLSLKFNFVTPPLFEFVGWVVLAHAVISMLSTLLLSLKRPPQFEKFQAIDPSRIQKPKSVGHAIAGAFRDLFRPAFLIPIFLVCGIMFASKANVQEVLWTILRAMTIGVVLFAIVRWFDPRGLVNWLKGKGHWGPAYALRVGLNLGANGNYRE